MMASVYHLRRKHILILAVLSLTLLWILQSDLLHHSNYENVDASTLGRRLSQSKDDDYIVFHEDSAKVNEQQHYIPTLREKQNEIPVIVVDEHNEVIPYWYKAVEEGIIRSKANTLIHIDGHSDMAPPDNYKYLALFEHKEKAPESSYLPLMQYNDAFIISAILKGLISHVVWVIPSWSQYSSLKVVFKSYVGTYTNKTTGKTLVCECQERMSKNKKKKLETECVYLDRELNEEDGDLVIQQSDCKEIRRFTYIILGEDAFIRSINLKKVHNLFVDIDEDYFGVESGVQQAIDQGISIQTQSTISEIFVLFCPKSVEVEQILNKKMQRIFGYISKLPDSSKKKRIRVIKQTFFKETRAYACKSLESIDNIYEEAAELIASLTVNELKALSTSKYCLFNSPRLEKEETRFQLCTGVIYPGDKLNQIYVGGKNEITQRGKQIKNILEHIYNQTEPRFFTIARSLRDGYTPRKQQRLIESVLIKSLREVIENHGKQQRVLYDRELVFGKNGWL